MESCLNMTEDQALSIYWESFRQNARMRLQNLEELAAVKSSNSFKDVVRDLELRATPPDPEGDGDFGKDDMKTLKKSFGRMKEVSNVG